MRLNQPISHARLGHDEAWVSRVVTNLFADITDENSQVMLVLRMGRAPDGREKLAMPHQRAEALQALADGSANQADLARRFNVSQATISRLRP